MSITPVLGGSAQVKILEFFLTTAELDHTKNEIAEKAEIPRTHVQPAIESLLGVGLLTETRRLGNSTFYKVNLESPLIKTLQTLDSQVAAIQKKAPAAAHGEKKI